jgi:putative peptide zinc metalloprotease protein
VQVFLHECGHIAALHYFGKKPDKMGFRMNFYVFPAFYVRMNQAHLLTRGERAIVHSSGLFANCMIVIIVAVITRIIDYPQLFMANWIFTGGLIANMTPLLNADGYKLLVTLLGLNEAKHINRKHPVILTLRLLSIFVILWYFWTIWLTLKKEFAF